MNMRNLVEISPDLIKMFKKKERIITNCYNNSDIILKNIETIFIFEREVCISPESL